MVATGVLVTIAGFLITLLGLGMTSSVNARMMLALLGIAVSFTGIMGVINPAFMKNAIWRK